MPQRLLALLLCAALFIPSYALAEDTTPEPERFVAPTLPPDAIAWDSSHPDILDEDMLYARSAILIGAGNLGRAIANHMQFEARGFELIGIFDRREELTGQQINGITIRNSNTLGQFCEEHHPVVAFLCIPREATMETAQQLIDYGVKGFWNFSHYDLSVQFPEVVVENVHLGDSLLTLSYRISEVEDQKDSAAKKL